MVSNYIRVDDRLIHGQITTNWINYLDIEQIIVIDNKTAANAMLKSIMSMAVPDKIDIEVVSEEDFSKAMINEHKNTLLIVKYPPTIKFIFSQKVEISKLYVGTVVKQENSEKITKNVYLTEEFKQNLLEVKDQCDILLQQLPDNSITKM